MIRLTLATAIAAATFAPAAMADTKATSCKHQSAIVAALQAARLERVKEAKVASHILAADHSWPDKYDAAIAIMTPWVYEQKRKDLKSNDLSAAWSELCLAQ